MALLLVAGCTAQPTVVTDMNGFIYSTAGKQITITEYKGNATTAVLPAVYNNNPVIGLASGALKGSTITDITLPSSITTVTAGAFIGSNVKSISIKGISSKFAAKDGVLYDFKMHDLVAYPPKKEGSELHIEQGINNIKEGAFQENSFVQRVVFDGYKIEPRAFFKAESLKRVELTKAVTLERLAFASSALEEIILPETLTFIDQTALADCGNLKKITVKKDSYAHSWCIENGFEDITVTE
jgi:hypothetical protein